MPEISRLSGSCDAIELDFVERESASKEMLELAIHLHLGSLSLSDTVFVLDNFEVSRVRSTVHNWVQKADLEPRGGRDPEKIALDETVVKVNDEQETVVKVNGEQFWLVAAVEPDTNVMLPSRNTAPTKMFLRELEEKHAIDNAEFFVDGEPWLHAGLHG